MISDTINSLTEAERRAERDIDAARISAADMIKAARSNAADILSDAEKRAAKLEKDAIKRAEDEFEKVRVGHSVQSADTNDPEAVKTAAEIIKSIFLK